jgi:hypothetical protein
MILPLTSSSSRATPLVSTAVAVTYLVLRTCRVPPAGPLVIRTEGPQLSTVTRRVAMVTSPPRSYARNASVTARPRPVVRQEKPYGATRSVPTTTPSATSCTLAMPSASEADARTVTVPRTRELPPGVWNEVTGGTPSAVAGSAARAAAALTRPEDFGTQVPKILSAERVSVARMVAAVGAGVVEASSAATPAANGVAEDVPQNWPTLPLRACAGLQPGAAMSTQLLP